MQMREGVVLWLGERSIKKFKTSTHYIIKFQFALIDHANWNCPSNSRSDMVVSTNDPAKIDINQTKSDDQTSTGPHLLVSA